jgi:isoquinoline 1-oxidoreductase beta subunit
MTTLKNPSRRKFLKSSAVAGGALVIAVQLPQAIAKAAVKTSMPNAWIRIGSDNTVTVLVARSEMGQGVVMALPTLVAEELEVDLNKIKVDFAPPGEVYINGMLGGQITGGSTSVRDGWDKLRIAGAQARMMLTEAAAQQWKVDAAKCTAKDGVVTGPGGKKATYGQLAEAASKLTPPKEPKLKDPSQFRYVGKPLKRLDTASKINGTCEFGSTSRCLA